MPTIKSFSEIVNSMIERLRLTQPNLDTKIGSVSRDVFIDMQADQLEGIYQLIQAVSDKQSFATATGLDLDRIARNFGITRNSGSFSSGLIVFTTKDITTDISIPDGTTVSTASGVSFRTVGNYSFSPSQKNIYSANASRIRDSLNKAGISDGFSIEVPIQAVSRGTLSNISSYQINQNNTSELTVINIQSTSGGADPESDSVFRTRIFSLFNGSNTGTSLGFKNAALSVQGVIDALVVEPGNSLMLRDGSEVIQSEDGNLKILNSGTGGKVDLYILGNTLEEVTETFIFRDKSDDNNISDDKNDILLGYSNQDLTKTILERRLIASKTGSYPMQPVNTINFVSGNLSGELAEFDGETGSYQLIKDYNPETGGSLFGFDKIKFISSRKYIDGESVLKLEDISGDPISFSEVDGISSVYQDIQITSENSNIDQFDRSIIYLNHKPLTLISSVLNINTGEFYSVSTDNFQNGINQTGIVKISGQKLPSLGDKLKVNYTWRSYFDQNINIQSDTNFYFKNKEKTDLIYWGSNNYIKKEKSVIVRNSDDTNFAITLENNIEDILSVYESSTLNIIVSKNSTNDLFLEIPSSSGDIKNIISIYDSNGVEVYNTPKSDGYFKLRSVFLPTDISIGEGDSVTMEYNRIEYYNLEDGDSSFSSNSLILPSDFTLKSNGLFSKVESLANSITDINIDYIAKKETCLPTYNISALPISNFDLQNYLISSSGQIISNSFQPVEFEYENGEELKFLRNSPARLNISVSSVASEGSIRIQGETLTKVVADISGYYFTGKKFNLKQAILSALNFNEIDETISIAKLTKVTAPDGTVLDIFGYSIKNNSLDYGIAKKDSDLQEFEVMIPSTSLNNSISYSSGQMFEIEFYIRNSDDFENLYFYNSGNIYTDKIYLRINKVSLISGFRNESLEVAGFISINKFNKPTLNSTYNVDYSFVSPKEGEAITISYNRNKLIADASTEVEKVRTITSDILIKEAQSLAIDVSGLIVISDDFLDSSGTVLENVINQINTLLNTNTLSPIIDYSDVISVATTVEGVDSVNINKFCLSGETGKRSYIKALDNQTISPGVINIEIVSRKNFRI